jgi:hypothetical protein
VELADLLERFGIPKSHLHVIKVISFFFVEPIVLVRPHSSDVAGTVKKKSYSMGRLKGKLLSGFSHLSDIVENRCGISG